MSALKNRPFWRCWAIPCEFQASRQRNYFDLFSSSSRSKRSPIFLHSASPVLIDIPAGTEIASSQSVVSSEYNWQITLPFSDETITGAVSNLDLSMHPALAKSSIKIAENFKLCFIYLPKFNIFYYRLAAYFLIS